MTNKTWNKKKSDRMNNNDIFRRLRYALNLNDRTMTEIFKISGYKIEAEELAGLLKKEEEDGFINLNDNKMEMFLDGLITYKRGKQELKPGQKAPEKEKLDNNVILKKIRIALALRGEDVLDIMKLADTRVSASEISAIFRKKDHRNYKSCGDRYVRNFLKGLTKKYRG